ncbi:MAG: peptidoglycan-binding protein LysM [Flavobacteriaceae bacterium]|nr:peptidoglycan-binding protein LysM [Bacteroidia bacterium]MBT8288895.1 peptidoglycan-binding protein LysM [Bacteroidia bacterium]NNF74078.1 peptidoglycan-binding protein LysM [Flavobacteriaceae bacterium]NNK73564.1 peptidoglycan-binding protein LysM [Flavobacteriaceae bacterium]
MSLFSFIKNAGTAIFGVKSGAKEANKAAEAELKAEEAAAARLKETIHDLQLKVENLNIHIDDDKATVRGAAYDQSTREKIVLVVGNSEGIAAVDDQMSVQHTEPEAQFHTVVSGDSLSKISKKYYGDPMKYPVIFEANKPMLSDPDKIYPGQVLRIPHIKA